jgi:uncharacterized membrane protein YedE/YeeE
LSIDWVHFSPLSSFSGGLLIGLSACCLVLFVGRVAGISGILGSLLRPQSGESVWRIAFLGGLLVHPAP